MEEKFTKSQDKKLVSFTLDIDWAPDFVLDYCLQLFADLDIKALFFVTHDTEMLKEITQQGHRLGIHPNFQANSTQGANISEIMDYCLSLVPEGKIMRTHSLVSSTPLLAEITQNFPQITTDVSTLMHRSTNAFKCEWTFGESKLDRIVYNWEDDAEFKYQRYSNVNDLFFGSLTIYDFHPIHIFLNSSNGSEYKQWKKVKQSNPLGEEAHALRLRNKGSGVETFLRNVMKHQPNQIFVDAI